MAAKSKLKRANTEIAYTPEQIQELAKCMRSPQHFCRNHVVIKHPVRGDIPFNLYDYQDEMLDTYVNNRNVIVLSARQTGKSETSAAYILWYAIFKDKKTILVVSNRLESAKEVLSRIKYMYEALPDWLKPGVSDDEWNKTSIKFDNGSRIIVDATTADSGRGKSISLLYCDELAFVPANIQEDFWNAVSPTLSTGGECIISSTPNGDHDLFARLWRDADNGTGAFVPVFVPWYLPPGRDEKFKQEEIAKIGHVRWLQEYECKFISTSATVFDSLSISVVEQDIDAKGVQPILRYEGIDFWEEIDKNSDYIVTVDPSTAGGVDNTVFEIFKIDGLIQVGEFASDSISTGEAYDKLKKLLYYLEMFGNDIFFTIENNGIGEGIISLYQNDEKVPDSMFISHPGKVGVRTNNANKRRNVMTFKDLFESRKMVVRSKRLLKEMKTYTRRGESYGAMKSSTDDRISAVLLMMEVISLISSSHATAYNTLYAHNISKDTVIDTFPDNDNAGINSDSDSGGDTPALPIII